MINFSAQIAAFAAGTPALTRVRRQDGTTSFGIFTPGPETRTSIIGVVIRGVKNQALLPQGERTDETCTLYTTADLRSTRTPDGALADLIEYEGETYEVKGVQRWTAHGNYLECALVKVTQ